MSHTPRRVSATRGLAIAILVALAGTVGIDEAWGAGTDSASLALRELALSFNQDTEPECVSSATALAGDPNVFEAKRMLETLRRCIARQKQNASRAMTAGGAEPRAVLASAEIEFAAADQLVESLSGTVEAGAQFRGLSWGVGFGVSQGFDDVISEAALVEGVIVSSKDETQQARVILETHRYWLCGESKVGDKFGCGPAGFLVTGQQDVLAGVGLGFMFGWKSKDDAKGTGLSLGFGVLLDNDIKALADGFDEGQPLPPGEPEIRFETKARWSGIVFFTRTF